MPQGGQISAGSGLQLQPTTPGSTDIGNFDISGKGITKNGFEPLAEPTQSSRTPVPGVALISIGGGRTFSGGANAAAQDKSGSIMIGHNQQIFQNPNGNADADDIVIGRAAISYGSVAVVIGQGARSGDGSQYPTSAMENVVIGQGAMVYTQKTGYGSVAIGVAATVGTSGSTPTTGATVIGHAARATNNLGQNVVICSQGAALGGSNCIWIDTSQTGTSWSGESNAIKIGDSTQTTVYLGNINFTYVVYVAQYRATSSVTITNTAASTTIIGAGSGTLAGGPSNQMGKAFRIRARGDLQTNGAGQTLALIGQAWMPSWQAGVYGVIFNRSAGTVMALPNTPSLASWELDIECRLTVAGGNGTPPIGRLVTTGSFTLNVDGAAPIRWNPGLSGTMNYCDSTDAFTLDVQIAWGAASANNIFNCHVFEVDQVGL